MGGKNPNPVILSILVTSNKQKIPSGRSSQFHKTYLGSDLKNFMESNIYG